MLQSPECDLPEVSLPIGTTFSEQECFEIMQPVLKSGLPKVALPALCQGQSSMVQNGMQAWSFHICTGNNCWHNWLYFCSMEQTSFSEERQSSFDWY